MAISEPATLSPVEWVALGIVGREAAKVRDKIEPCSRKAVDILLRIRGTVSVGADSEATTWQKPSAEELLGWILKYLRTRAPESLDDAIVSDAKANDGTLPEVEEGYVDSAKSIIKQLSQKRTSPRRGSTRGSFEVGIVEMERLSQPASAAVQKFTRAIVLADPEDAEAKA